MREMDLYSNKNSPDLHAGNNQAEKTLKNAYLGTLYIFVFQFLCCFRNGILLPKLFWTTVRKNCSTDWEKLEFEAEGQEFAKLLRSLEQFIQTVKGQNNFW